MTSSDTYMPDMSEARLAYILGVKEILSRGGYASNSKTLGAEFDRFITKVGADALIDVMHSVDDAADSEENLETQAGLCRAGDIIALHAREANTRWDKR